MILLQISSDSSLVTGRKTEEGFSIFKEDELGIGDEGGGVDVIVNLHFVTHFYSPVQILLFAHSIVNVVS